MKKKVLIAITQSNFGGAQRYVFDLATSLSVDAYDVCVVAGGSGRLLRELEERGVRSLSLAALGRNVNIFADIRIFFELFQLLRKERPDILHLNSSKIGGIGALAGRVAGVPRVVFTAHGWEFNAPRALFQRVLIRLFSILIVYLAHQTIAVSQAIRSDMPQRLQRKIVVIHNGVAAFSLLPREEARARLNKNRETTHNELWIGTVAELHPVKGLRYGIEAFAHVRGERPMRYFLLGEGKDHAALQEYIRSLHCESQIQLAGFVEHAERYLAAFDIVLMPSLSEGLSYSALEAGAAGRALIASNVGGIPEIIENGVHGILVPAKDTQAIAGAIIALALDERNRARLGETFRARVQKDFSLEKMVQKTSAAYENIV